MSVFETPLALLGAPQDDVQESSSRQSEEERSSVSKTVRTSQDTSMNAQSMRIIPVDFPKDSPARFLLMRLRDEAHRFANRLREKKATVAMIITTKVVTLMPPAVEVGPPPISISEMNIIEVLSWRAPMSVVLKPAVRVVTPWNQLTVRRASVLSN